MGICFIDNQEKAKFTALVNAIGRESAEEDYYQYGEVRDAEDVLRSWQRDILRHSIVNDITTPIDREKSDMFADENTLQEIRSMFRKQNQKDSISFIRQFSNRLGIPFEIVTYQDALTISKKHKLTGGGFYAGGKVYFIEGEYNSDSVFHEFAHPLIKALKKYNPEVFNSLLSEVPIEYADEIRGKYENDPAYNVENEGFVEEMNEEILVHYMTQINAEEFEQPQTLAGKILFHIKQLLRKIFGRKIDLKTLSKKTTLKDFVKMLNYGNEFAFDTEFLQEDDFVYLEKRWKKLKKTVNEETVVQAQVLIDKMYNMVSSQIQSLEETSAGQLYAEMLLGDKSKETLAVMEKTLRALKGTKQNDYGKIIFREGLTKDIESLTESQKLILDRLNTFVYQISEIGAVVDKIAPAIQEIKTLDIADPLTLDKIFVLTQLLENYNQFLKEATNLDSGAAFLSTQVASPVKEELTKLQQKVYDALQDANELRVNILTESLYDYMVDKTERATKLYETQLAVLKQTGNKNAYNRLHAEYHGLTLEELEQYNNLKAKSDNGTIQNEEIPLYNNLKERRLTAYDITKEEFKQILTEGYGQGQAAGAIWNNLFESYSLNQDPVIGSFYSYVKQNMNQINAASNARQAALLGSNDELRKLLYDAGYGSLNRNLYGSALGRELGHTHITAKWSHVNNDWEKGLEWRFLSNYLDYDFAVKDLQRNLKNAQKKHQVNNTKETQDALAEIEEQIFWFRLDYFHQVAVDSYYENEALLFKNYSRIDTDIKRENIRRKNNNESELSGKELEDFKNSKIEEARISRLARQKLNKIYEQINDIGDELQVINDMEVAEARAEKWRELNRLKSEYENGERKTGDALAIAQLLKEHQQGRLNTYTSRINEVLFDSAYKNELDRIQQIEKNDDQRDALMDQWLATNTQVVVEDSYYERLGELVDEKMLLLAPVIAKNEQIAEILKDEQGDYEELQNAIKSIVKPTRDDSGQYNGDLLSTQEQQKLRDYQQTVENITFMFYNLGTGVTGSDLDSFFSLKALVDMVGEVGLSTKDKAEWDRLMSTMANGLSNLGLDTFDIDRILAIDAELQSMSAPIYTGYYIDHYQKLYDNSKRFRDIFKNFFRATQSTSEKVGLGVTVIQQHEIEELLKSEYFDLYLRPLISTPESEEEEAFADWFNNNHYEGTRWEKYQRLNPEGEFLDPIEDTKWSTESYKLTNAWRNSVPVDKDYYKTYVIHDEDGAAIEVLRDSQGRFRVPNINYQTRELREDLMTEIQRRDIVDENNNLTLANQDVHGRWLPKDYLGLDENGKPIEGGAIDNRFVDANYKKMFEEDRAKFDLLDHLKNWHLDNQLGMHRDAKLGLTYPKERMRGLGDAASTIIGNAKGNTTVTASDLVARKWRRVKEFWGAEAADEFADGLNSAARDYKRRAEQTLDDQNLTNKRPVRGVFDLPIDEVSTDILGSLQVYNHSLQEHRAFQNMNSLSKTLHYTLNEHSKKNLKQKIVVTDAITSIEQEELDLSNQQRTKVINNIIDRYFAGINQVAALRTSGDASTPMTKEERGSNKRLENLTRFALKQSSRKWFIFNAMSSLTNFLSAETQRVYLLIDNAVTRNNFGVQDYAFGHKRAVQTLGLYSLLSYSSRTKPLQLQLMDILDASPERYARLQADAGSRTILEDIARARPGYAMRTFTSHEVNYATAYSFMHNKKYKFRFNGEWTSLYDAVELVDGRIQTKEGVPEEWSISYKFNEEGIVTQAILGREIRRLIDHQHSFLSKMHGMAGSTEEGDFLARRWYGKLISFLFKFLPGMIAHRYQTRVIKERDADGKIVKRRVQSRMNWQNEMTEDGIYLQSLYFFKSIAQSAYSVVNPSQKAHNYVSKAELSGLLQTTAAILFSKFLYAWQMSIWFGEDDDDEIFGGSSLHNYGPIGLDKNAKNFLKYRTSATPDLPWVSVDWNAGRGGFGWENWWKGQTLRLLQRVERENNTFHPWVLPQIGIQTFIGQNAAYGGIPKDLMSLGEYFSAKSSWESKQELAELYDWDLGSKSEPGTIGKLATPYLWSERGGDKLTHLLISRYLGFNGMLLDPFNAYLLEAKFNPGIPFSNPWDWNPFIEGVPGSTKPNYQYIPKEETVEMDRRREREMSGKQKINF